MPVPVSLRPDRRGQVYRRGRGWIPIEETREHQRKQREAELQEEHWERKAQEHQRKQQIRSGFQMLFGGDADGG